MPTTEIPMEVVLYPVAGGTIAPFRVSRVKNATYRRLKDSSTEPFWLSSGFYFSGDSYIFYYKLEEYTKYDNNQLSDVLKVYTYNSYASIAYEQNLYFQAVIHDFEKEIVFVEHGTDNVITEPNTMVEISNNRMNSDVIDVDVIYRTIPWNNYNVPKVEYSPWATIRVYPEIINYGNYGIWKPESI